MSDSSSSNKGLIIGASIAGAVVLLGIFLFASYSSAVAFGTQQESALQATYDNNKNFLGNFTSRIGDMAQVPAAQRDDLKDVLKTALEARYGSDGSGAAMQFIKEAYPGQLDNKLYENLQSAIESGRIEFRDQQTKLIDQKRIYTNNLGYVWKGSMLKWAGFPKVDMNKFNIVTSSSAEKSFATGVDDGLTLRPTAPAAPAGK